MSDLISRQFSERTNKAVEDKIKETINESQEIIARMGSDSINRAAVSAWLYNMGYENLSNAVMDKKRFPSSEQERMKGKWITTRTWEHDGEIYCSHCSGEALTDGDYRQVITDYCPHCGADMRGEKMSVLIKGIEIPKEPWDCPCHDGENGRCKVTKNSCYQIPKDCPLVEVPTEFHDKCMEIEIEKSTNMDDLISRQDAIKAYTASDRNGDTGFSIVVFAETAGKAKAYAANSDGFDEYDFTEIRVNRRKELDRFYKGKREMDWMNDEDRVAMVRYANFECSCEVVHPECERDQCPAQQWCGRYERMKDE